MGRGEPVASPALWITSVDKFHLTTSRKCDNNMGMVNDEAIEKMAATFMALQESGALPRVGRLSDLQFNEDVPEWYVKSRQISGRNGK